MRESIETNEDLLIMLDSLLREPNEFWDTFYTDRNKKIPFFENKPDENLVAYYNSSLMDSGRVLELGSGPGRNAIYFAEQNCEVDAIDLSLTSIQWAKERAIERQVDIHFIHENLFDVKLEPHTYDIVYDSGCFHHIAPHRRNNYKELVWNALKPGGLFAITCFVEGGALGGSSITDWEVYRQRSLNGGLGFTSEKLQSIFSDYEVIEMREMKEMNSEEAVFGASGLWTALFRKNE